MTETIRKAAVANTNVCLESGQSLATSPQSPATERALAAEVVASFDLCAAVAKFTGMPADSSLAELTEAMRRRI